MSVLINMEMPKSCADCPIGDTLCCSLMPGVPALWKEYTLAIKTNRRHSGCPLVPVPPHGRLIDADALISQYSGNIWTANTDYAEGLRDIIADVKAAPTIIPPSGGKKDE